MDDSVMHFIKDWLWAPLLGLIAWAWQRNEKEHEMLWKTTEKLQKYASESQSSMNDRFVSHVDDQVNQVRADHGKRIDKINDHIAKLFENAEKDRATFRDALGEHARHSESRHLELLKGQQEILMVMHTGLSQKADK